MTAVEKRETYTVLRHRHLQLCPAPAGLRVLFADPDDPDGPWLAPVMCFALTMTTSELYERHTDSGTGALRPLLLERSTDREVYGMWATECGLEPAEPERAFRGYVAAGEDLRECLARYNVEATDEQLALLEKG